MCSTGQYGQPVSEIVARWHLVLTVTAVVIRKLLAIALGIFRGAAVLSAIMLYRTDFRRLFGAGVLARADVDHPVFRQARLAADFRHRQ
jgi:hypothetical protein